MKRVKQLLCLLLAMVMVITAVPNMQAYATGLVTPNGGKKHGNMGGLTTCHGGASVSKQGFRLYIVDENGNVVSKFKTHDKKGNVIEAQVRDLYIGVNEGTTTVGDNLRVGDGDLAPGRMKAPAGMPSAFVGQNWTTNGKKVAQWMNTKEKRTIEYTYKGKKVRNRVWVKNCQYLCYYAMGIRAFNMVMDYESKYTIVLEPTVFHVVWRSTSKNSSTGTSFYGTAHDWLLKYNKMGVTKTWTSSCESYVLQCALTLKRNEHHLTKPTSEVTKSNQLTLRRVGSQGFGIHFYTLNGGSDPDYTDTFDFAYNNSKFRPEKAPRPKKSTENWVTIVKTYRVKKIDKDGNVKYIDKGTFVRKNNPAIIRIENEPTSKIQYHVIGYQTTDKVKKSIDALKWKSIMKNKKLVGNATKSKLALKPNNEAVITKVKLHKKIEKQRDPKTHKKKTIRHKYNEIVLYVLLQKEQKEKPISGDYTLKQSQISKKVDLYKTEKDKDILKNHSFVWDSSALNDACVGHTYFCGGRYCSGHIRHCSWSLADTSLNLAIMNARYRADEYKYNIAYKAWDDEWEDTEVANQC